MKDKLGDVIWTIMACIGFFAMVWVLVGEDDRPDRIKYITDPRNKCVLVDDKPLANEYYHVRNETYAYKHLKLFECVNGQHAAIIEKE